MRLMPTYGQNRATSMRAVIYCRVSTKEQAQNLSLPTQLKACREYCERQGLEVASVFEDAGESAKTIDRPDFQRLLSYCRQNKGKIQFVVVYNVTRFSRSHHDHAVIRALLLKLGVSLRSVTEPIGDDAVGQLMENVLASFAQFDNNQKAERTKAGMRAALDRGRWTWMAPLGYRNGNLKAGEASLVLDPERAPLVRRAFELMASGNLTASEVLAKVTALGLVTRTGQPVKPQTFGALLRKSTYIGLLNAPGFKLNGVRGDFEPLIAENLFYRVQAVLDRKRPFVPHARDRSDFPLRRFVVCDACQTPLTGSSPKGRSKNYSYYHCRKCRGVSVRREVLERRFVELLESLKPRKEFMRLFSAIVVDVWQARRQESSSLRESLALRLDDLKRREAMLEEAYLYRQAVDRETYERQRDLLREQIALVTLQAEDAKLEEVDVDGLLGFAEFVLSNAARLWSESNYEQQLRMQHALFPEGLRFRNGGFGTAVTCLAFRQLQPMSAEEMSNPGHR